MYKYPLNHLGKGSELPSLEKNLHIFQSINHPKTQE